MRWVTVSEAFTCFFLFVNQEEYREKRNKYLSRSESLLFDLYDESVDDDDFALYIDRASTPIDRRSAEPGLVSTSRGSSVTRSAQLQPPDSVQRSSSCTGPEVLQGMDVKNSFASVKEVLFHPAFVCLPVYTVCRLQTDV